ncbi:MAG: phosphoribosylformylglycinamidine cyclo-ligase [Defluviitaleaceae bacterium]|nr:phosphoribosylformylglycinamidine cyclo-ligase [Defluviitaleaceae bacterium]
MSNAYAKAGVDVHAGYRSVELIRKHIESTFTSGVFGGLGGFGGMFSMAEFKIMEDPIMVFGADGVGTKIELARIMDKHDTVGIDLVAMCVNDILCCGAKPLVFLDYIACGKNVPERVEQIVAGMSEGCRQAGAALVGGETAEHPGLMDDDEYDLGGFAMGVVDKPKMIDGTRIKAGDVLIGLSSSGTHSNGFSLIRKVLGVNAAVLNIYVDELSATFGEILLTPTKIYVKSVLALLETYPDKVLGISHMTGGGIIENLPRFFPKNAKLTARVDSSKLQTPPIFDIIAKKGGIDRMDMFGTFNMGIGMVLCVPECSVDNILKLLEQNGEKAHVIGDIIKRENDLGEICIK